VRRQRLPSSCPAVVRFCRLGLQLCTRLVGAISLPRMLLRAAAASRAARPHALRRGAVACRASFAAPMSGQEKLRRLRVACACFSSPATRMDAARLAEVKAVLGAQPDEAICRAADAQQTPSRPQTCAWSKTAPLGPLVGACLAASPRLCSARAPPLEKRSSRLCPTFRCTRTTTTRWASSVCPLAPSFRCTTTQVRLTWSRRACRVARSCAR